MAHEEEDLKSMSLGDHLEELRGRLILAIMGLFIGMVICLFFGKFLIGVMSAPFDRVITGLEEEGLVKQKDDKNDGIELADRPQALVVTYDAVNGYQSYESLAKVGDLLEKLHDAEALRDDPNSTGGEAVGNAEKDLRHVAVIAQHPDAGFVLYCSEQDVSRVLGELKESGAIVDSGQAKTVVVRQGGASIVTHAPVEGFMTYMKVCILFGLLLSSPWVIWQIWAFVSAGLYRKEKKYIKVVAPISTLLFIVGALFFMAVVAPLAMRFLIRFDAALGFQSFWSLQKYINMVFSLTLVFGAAFQMPIAIVFAEMLGLVSIDMLTRSRKFVILGLVVVAAMATPPDVISQISLAIPLYGLYEASIVFCRIRRKRNKDNPYAVTE